MNARACGFPFRALNMRRTPWPSQCDGRSPNAHFCSIKCNVFVVCPPIPHSVLFRQKPMTSSRWLANVTLHVGRTKMADKWDEKTQRELQQVRQGPSLGREQAAVLLTAPNYTISIVHRDGADARAVSVDRSPACRDVLEKVHEYALIFQSRFPTVWMNPLTCIFFQPTRDLSIPTTCSPLTFSGQAWEQARQLRTDVRRQLRRSVHRHQHALHPALQQHVWSGRSRVTQQSDFFSVAFIMFRALPQKKKGLLFSRFLPLSLFSCFRSFVQPPLPPCTETRFRDSLSTE